MIICKYKDGSSIRVYKSISSRSSAIRNFLNMGFDCKTMTNLPNHYSLKVFKPNIEVFLKRCR